MIDTGSNGLLKMLRKIGLPIFIKRFDMFGAPMPVFNIDGDQKHTTNTGGVLSIFIFYLTLLFAIVKFSHMISRQNPMVFSYKERDAFDTEEKFNFYTQEFKIAFSLEDYNTQETKMDTNYVKFYALYSNMTNGVREMTEVPLHQCNDVDYA